MYTGLCIQDSIECFFLLMAGQITLSLHTLHEEIHCSVFHKIFVRLFLAVRTLLLHIILNFALPSWQAPCSLVVKHCTAKAVPVGMEIPFRGTCRFV